MPEGGTLTLSTALVDERIEIAVADSGVGMPLEVREVPAVIECRDCGERTELDDPIFRCGRCGSTATDVVSGNELLVTSLDLTVS